MAEPQATTRDSAHVDREYGREKWPLVEQTVAEEIAAEREPRRLSRVIGRVARRQWPGEDPLALHDAIAGGVRVQLPRQSAYGAQRYMIAEVLMRACSERTELVLELGSGWSWHVLSLWLGGGPRDALYVGAEYTVPGRRAAAALAALEPELRFRSLAFDYNRSAAGLAELGRCSEALVFSQHSVEQIPQLPADLIDAIRGVADRVTCVHFEPIGWQLGQSGRDGSSRDYAEHHDYNRNLVELLRQAEGAGRIAIDAAAAEVVGVNPGNSTSVIVWHSVPGVT